MVIILENNQVQNGLEHNNEQPLLKYYELYAHCTIFNMGVKVYIFYILTSTRRKVNLTIDEGVEVTFILGGSEILLLVYNASS